MDELLAVEVAVSPVDKFREYLMTKGLRLTHERRLIVDEVFSDHEHFDADQLSERLSRGKPGRSVSRATVYRTLTLLVEAGLLRKVARPNDREVFEHDYGYPQHDHLHCQRCNRLIEFRSDELAEIRNAVGREHDFRVTGHRLIITGICADCRAKQHRPTRPLDLV